MNELFNTKDTTSEYEAQDISANKSMSILSYIGILFLIPMFTAKDSMFAKFHVKQGIVLCVLAFVVGIITGILNVVLSVAGLYIVLLLLQLVLSLPVVVLMVLGIMNASQGKAKELPLIGKFADKINI